jgi:para-aminobenzoate synthetase component 1
MLPGADSIDLRLTPLEAIARWPRDRPLIALHSGRLHSRWSRYSILAEPVAALNHAAGRSAWIGPPPISVPPLTHDPLLDLEQTTAADGVPYLGYLGYDIARQIERLPNDATDDHGLPDLQFHRCPAGLLYDNAEGTWSSFGPPDSELPDLSATPTTDPLFNTTDLMPDATRAEHEASIRRVLDYIAAGDVFQVNLAQRFTGRFEGDPRGLYLALAERSPAWFGAYVELLGGKSSRARPALVSTSPELFLDLASDGRVVTRPIKGTRPAAADPAQLLNSAKDTAELNMIIDLLRNDLGRVCRYGSVRITEPRRIESHPTVHHGVATVEGQLHPSQSLRHLLRATFPGGSVTGAPKVRAMQIIEELEPVRRGPYCGAIGLVQHRPAGFTARLSIAIRTLQVDPRRRRVHFSVGGGIVADSQPAAEYQETLDKAAAMLDALQSKTPTASA